MLGWPRSLSEGSIKGKFGNGSAPIWRSFRSTPAMDWGVPDEGVADAIEQDRRIVDLYVIGREDVTIAQIDAWSPLSPPISAT